VEQNADAVPLKVKAPASDSKERFRLAKLWY